MKMTTACPLDCYDACRIILDETGAIKGDMAHPVTKGFLCTHMNHFDEFETIEFPRYKSQTLSMEEALNLLEETLAATEPSKILYYRGSGNLGLMQRSLEHFFARYGATGTRGSLCDGAGEAAIVKGRGVNYPISPEMLEKSEVIVVWGRNVHTTHSHLLSYLKGKKLIVIDPVRIKLADQSDLHIQIKPHSDLLLALILSRFVVDKKIADQEFIQKMCTGYNGFSDLLQTFTIDEALDAIDVSRSQIGTFLEIVQGKKTVFLVGVGVQKYSNGADVLRAIDALGALLGVFGKEGCGISYLGSSSQDLKSPFDSVETTVSKPVADFSKFDLAFIQGSNPLAQMPDSSKVEQNYQKCSFKVYFGLYENETSQSADLIIPATTFLEKNDVRASYGDFTLQMMNQLRTARRGIGEYDLARRLCQNFKIEIRSEEECLKIIKTQIIEENGVETKAIYPKIPYQEGFATESGKFVFMEEANLDRVESEGFYLITPKSPRSLNSQFRRADFVSLHPGCGLAEGDNVTVSSANGKVSLRVVHDDRLRQDCALIYSGTPGVNRLTPSQMSREGESAVYQNNKVKVKSNGKKF